MDTFGLVLICIVVTLLSTFGYLHLLVVGTRRFDGRRNYSSLIILMAASLVLMLGAGIPLAILWALVQESASLSVSFAICGGFAACFSTLYVGIKKPDTLQVKPKRKPDDSETPEPH